MFTLSIPEAMDFAEHIAIRMREPIMFWGQPGVGKSQMVAQLALKYAARLVDIRLSQYDSVDLRGIPSVKKVVIPPHILPGERLSVNDAAALAHHTSTTVWNVPSTLPFKGNPNFDPKAKYIFLFLDEINSSAPAVSAVAYQLINDRAVGEHELMDNVVIIAAGNREGDKGITNKMPTPLANRFTHAEVGLNVDAACVHFQSIGVHPVGIAFLQFRKDLLSTFMVQNKDGSFSVTNHKSFATPRTWEKAFRYFADTTMPDAVKRAGMAGAVGDAESTVFWGFVDVFSRIDKLMPTIMKSPKTAEIPEELDLCYAIAVSLSGSMTTQTVGTIWQYLKRMAPEFVVLAWMLATKRDEALYASPEFVEYSKLYKGVFV